MLAKGDGHFNYNVRLLENWLQHARTNVSKVKKATRCISEAVVLHLHCIKANTLSRSTVSLFRKMKHDHFLSYFPLAQGIIAAR